MHNENMMCYLFTPQGNKLVISRALYLFAKISVVACQRKSLLEVIKETVLSHLTKKCPPHVRMISQPVLSIILYGDCLHVCAFYKHCFDI